MAMTPDGIPTTDDGPLSLFSFSSFLFLPFSRRSSSTLLLDRDNGSPSLPLLPFAAYEEIRSKSVDAYRSVGMKETMVCPKSQRLSLLHATLSKPSFTRPLRWHTSYEQQVLDSKARNELLDIIVSKGSTAPRLDGTGDGREDEDGQRGRLKSGEKWRGICYCERELGLAIDRSLAFSYGFGVFAECLQIVTQHVDSWGSQNRTASPPSSIVDKSENRPKSDKLLLKKKQMGSEARAELLANADVDLQLLGEAEHERQLQKQKKHRRQGYEDEEIIGDISVLWSRVLR